MAGGGPMTSIWMCPVCEGDLQRDEVRFACSNGHSFDISREGYVNLLLVQHRRSSAAGDPIDSVHGRRAFLEGEGGYKRLAAQLKETVAGLPKACTEAPRVLDIGCGEGYFLRYLSHALPHLRLFGIDLAKEAMRLAAKASPEIEFAVGNTFRLPVRSGAVDGVLQIFAPADAIGVKRILGPGGWLLQVSPGPRHLTALRQFIYETPHDHPSPETPAGFVQLHQEQLTFPLHLASADSVAQLVAMTPYKWHTNMETSHKLGELSQWEATADFVITVSSPAEEQKLLE